MKCISRPETPNILIITPECVSNNRSFADSAVKNFVFVFMVVTHEFEGTKFLVPQKNYLCLPSHATLAPDIQISKFVALVGTNDADVTRGESR